MIHHHRGNRRDTTEKKAKRKAEIVHALNDYKSFCAGKAHYKSGRLQTDRS